MILSIFNVFRIAVFMLRDSFCYVNKADSLHTHIYIHTYDIVYTVQLLKLAPMQGTCVFLYKLLFSGFSKNTLCARTPQITDTSYNHADPVG